MVISKAIAKTLAAVVVTVGLCSCIINEGPPLAEAEAEELVDLDASESATLHFDVEAHATGLADETFRVVLSQPSPSDLSQQEVAVELGQEVEGEIEEGWPGEISIQAGETFSGRFDLTLTNNSQNSLELPVVIRVMADPGGVASGGEESLDLAIRRIHPGG